jgi:radical SAM-linked protein
LAAYVSRRRLQTREGVVAVPLPDRLGIQFSVDAEARFLSHHDTMRLMAHAAERARVPVAYSGGFNPHPKLSLPLPRPVGVAGHGELLALELAEPMADHQVVAALAAQMPEGIAILHSVVLPDKWPLQPMSADYELPLAADEPTGLAERLSSLETQPSWPCTRQEFSENSGAARRGQQGRSRQLELRELVTRLSLEGQKLAFTLISRQQVWARVDEVLVLVGLQARERSRVIRTAIHWQSGQRPSSQATDGTQE